jgi:hypothetical protein
MATVMHIVPTLRANAHDLGLPVALTTHCGITLRPGHGAARNAPLCPTCQRHAGWGTQDRRR